jgi:hypothetical protein
MAILTATADATTGSVLLVGTFTGYPDGTPITVYRVTPDGVETPVRGGNPILLSSGMFVLYDFEAPLDTAVSYRAVDPSGLLAYDSFTRTVAAGSWGSTDTGQAYTLTGTATDFSVNGTQGIQAPTAVNSFRSAVISVGTPTQRVQLTTSVVAVTGAVTGTGIVTGAPITARVWGRYTDANNYYEAQLSYNTDDTIALYITERVAGVGAVLAGPATIATSFTDYEQFTIQFDITDTTYPVLRAKAWATATEVEPDTWDLEFTDTTTVLATGNSAGAASRLETGNTNVTPQILFDNLYVWGAEVSATSNTVTVDSSGDYGWIKDPVRPGNNMRLELAGSVYNPCAGTGLTAALERLDVEAYASATGVFDIVDNPKPLTVAQTRKAIASSLTLISRQLADITNMLDLLSPGADLLLQLPAVYGWAIGTYGSDFITVADTTASRLFDDMRVPIRRWQVPFRATDGPADTISGGTGGGVLAPDTATWQALKDSGNTWATLTATGNTWADVTQGDYV